LGCDVFYGGQLFNPILQEKVLELVRSYYSEGYYLVRPEPDTYYHTRRLWENPSELYPFNYYGVIPHLSDGSYLDRGQFIFDRSAGGELVTLHKIPGSYKMAWGDKNKDADFDVVVTNGGYDRMIESPVCFVFLLTLIKIKWWPEFNYGDDYCYDDEIMKKLRELGIDVALKKKDIDFNYAWGLYLKSSGKKNTRQKHDNKKVQSLFPEGDQEEEEEENPRPKLRLVNPNPEEISVEAMDLNIRNFNCLKRSGVENLGQLLKYSKKDLITIRNLGRKGVEEIIQEVKFYGYELDDDN
jgi:hypothetical protein